MRSKYLILFYEWVSVWLLFNAKYHGVTFRYSEDDIRFVLDQPAYDNECYHASSQRQPSRDRHTATRGQIILIYWASQSLLVGFCFYG
jgi:hypothetical protein